jgi:phospholipid transport system substrate-binding protein
MTHTLATWFLVAAAAAGPAALAPREVVQGAVSRVMTVLDEAKIARPDGGAPGKPVVDRVRTEIRRVAAELFDFDEIARRALSRHWAARSRAEQVEFVVLFTDLLERAYFGRIEAYAGERLLYTGETVDGDYATVRSRIVTRRRTETALDYRLHLIEGRWKVYDILVDGVSFVSTYRSEFDRVITSVSYDELLDRLRKRTVEVRPASGRGPE